MTENAPHLPSFLLPTYPHSLLLTSPPPPPPKKEIKSSYKIIRKKILPPPLSHFPSLSSQTPHSLPPITSSPHFPNHKHAASHRSTQHPIIPSNRTKPTRLLRGNEGKKGGKYKKIASGFKNSEKYKQIRKRRIYCTLDKQGRGERKRGKKGETEKITSPQN